MSKRLFGTDGIRGVAGQWPLSADFVRRIGYFAGRVLGAAGGRARRSLLVVRDTRRSGKPLQRALTRGLTAAGFRVHDGGVLPTPAAAVLLRGGGFAAGAVISASHNPARFNGIKFFSPRGTKISDSLEKRIEGFLLAPSPESVPRAGMAKAVPHRRGGADYLKFLRSTWPRGLDLRGMRLAVDCAHGATSYLAAPLFRSLGARVDVLSARPDGSNINRGCGALHPEVLARFVRARRRHIGAAFDGDGDRAIFADETGAVRDGETVLLAAARHLKARGRLKNNLVVLTVMANVGLRRALAALGIRTAETPVGDRHVWEAMERTGAVLGGEPSGHVIFREFLPTGDGLLTALQLLGILRSSGRPLSALASLAVRYPQFLLNVPVREKKPLESLNGFHRAVRDVEGSLGDAGRVLVRYSGTEPLLRIMVEGPDDRLIRKHAHRLAGQVRRAGL